VTFDMKAYQRHAGKLDLDGIDFHAFDDQPLSDAVLRCLEYMHDVEFHTACYLRNLLNTKAHHDPEITKFMTIWNYEELWHGEAIAQVLDHHERVSGTERVASTRSRLGWKVTTSPIGWMAFSAATPRFLSVHMTIGAINEWTAQAAYSRLAAVADHPVLTKLLKRVMRQEGRHIDVYATRAKDELSQSRIAQKITRGILKAVWTPVGAGAMPKGEMAHMAQTLFSGDEGKAAVDRVDQRVGRLPGLDGLTIMADAMDRYSSQPVPPAPATARRVPVAV
jgi:hypothetical protein